MNLIVVKVIGFYYFLVVLEAFSFNAERDVFFLLRVKNWQERIEERFHLETKSEILQSSYDPSKPTTFQIHGFTENHMMPHHNDLSKAILEAEDQNLFFVDWGVGSKAFYSVARNRVDEIAQVVGALINFLSEEASLKFENVTIIGFSLGAHIAGMTGKKFVKSPIRKVIGLDPAGPRFDINDPDKRLAVDSATYTECIHTGYILGTRDPFCQADFYVNGGTNQPGCMPSFGDAYLCSHVRVLYIYIESLTAPKAFYGLRCESADNALKKSCSNEPGAFLNNKENERKKIEGIFHVTTNGESPYGLGDH